MVAIQRPSSTQLHWRKLGCYVIVLISMAAMACLFVVPWESSSSSSGSSNMVQPLRGAVVRGGSKPLVAFFVDPTSREEQRGKCLYGSLDDLTLEERFPIQGVRHMVTPPKGGLVTLVCCETTVGPWNIMVHSNWAPLGAARFLEMVRAGYFSSQVALMRCLRHFICQFGIAGDPLLTIEFNKTLPDDPNWLPEGKDHRHNADGVKRFAKGYLAYAGSGPDSRSNQFIVGLDNVEPLAGGSPWEVPWGELVGAPSFDTLDKIYTGYGEEGPSQGKLAKEGTSESVRSEFPLLDYITSCRVVDQHEES